MDECKFQSGEALTTPRVLEDDTPHEQRQRETAWAEKITRGEGKLPMPRVALREPSSTIIALGQRLERIRSAELERYRSKLGTLEPAQRREVEALTRNILNKFLHGAVGELKALAGAPEQDVMLKLVRRMFELA